MKIPILLMDRGFDNSLVFIKATAPEFLENILAYPTVFFKSPESIGTSVKQEFFD